MQGAYSHLASMVGDGQTPLTLDDIDRTCRSLLLGLACNESAAGVKLNLAGVLSSSQAAHVLESCIHGVRCLQALDLSDNSECNRNPNIT